MHSRKNAISHSLKGIYLIQGMRFTMEENAFPDWITIIVEIRIIFDSHDHAKVLHFDKYWIVIRNGLEITKKFIIKADFFA
jgi:hypothetical protein